MWSFQSKKSIEVVREGRLRFQASSLIQLILVVLNSSHLSLPVTRWYVQELSAIQERAAQFKVGSDKQNVNNTNYAFYIYWIMLLQVNLTLFLAIFKLMTEKSLKQFSGRLYFLSWR